jgi:hypothetical protein
MQQDSGVCALQGAVDDHQGRITLSPSPVPTSGSAGPPAINQWYLPKVVVAIEALSWQMRHCVVTRFWDRGGVGGEKGRQQTVLVQLRFLGLFAGRSLMFFPH